MEEREALSIHQALHSLRPDCLFRGVSYPIKCHSDSRARSVTIMGAKFMTQNTKKNTSYAQRAKQGERLTWIMGSEPWGLIANDKIEVYPIIIIPNTNQLFASTKNIHSKHPVGEDYNAHAGITSHLKSLTVNKISNDNNINNNNINNNNNNNINNNNINNNNINNSTNNTNNNNDMNNANDYLSGNQLISSSDKNKNTFKHTGNTIMGPSFPSKPSGKRDSPENTSAPNNNNNAHNNKVFADLTNIAPKKMKLIDNFEIPYSELTLYNVLGSGSFGVVKKGRWRGLDVAVKLLTAKKPKAQALFLQEAELMCNFRHPNIVQILGISKQTTNGEMCIVMEYLGQTLKQLINTHGGLEKMTLSTFLQISKGIALGINYLHKSQPPVIHRDLKPANILLDAHGVPHVADFGVSRTKQKTSTMTKIGTPYYMAPEILLGLSYNEKVDVYSYGMLLYQMVSGKVPFSKMGIGGEDLTPIQIIMKVGIENIRPPIPETCPVGIRHLIELAWHKDPTIRPSFSKIILLLESFEVDGGNYFPEDLIRLDEAECEKTLLQTVEDM